MVVYNAYDICNIYAVCTIRSNSVVCNIYTVCTIRSDSVVRDVYDIYILLDLIV